MVESAAPTSFDTQRYNRLHEPHLMIIRNYEPDDLERLRQITVEAFAGIAIDQMIEGRYGLIKGIDWRSRKAKHVDADAAREPEGIFVAEIDGVAVGWVSSWTDPEAGMGYIPNIAVARRVQGPGDRPQAAGARTGGPSRARNVARSDRDAGGERGRRAPVHVARVRGDHTTDPLHQGALG